MAESIWAKISGAVKTGVKATGRVFVLVPKALIYPIKKPFASMSEVKHDAKVSLREAVGIDVPEEEKKYDPPIETTEASNCFSIQITNQGKGKVSFLASRTLTGDVPHLSSEQLGEIKKELPNINSFKEENKIVIEVDIEKITDGIKDHHEHKGKSAEEIKRLVLKAINDEVDRNLKGLAKITGGEFEIHTDLKLLYAIAEKLYMEYDDQKQLSSETVGSVGERKSSEEFLNSWQSKVDKHNCENIRRL